MLKHTQQRYVALRQGLAMARPHPAFLPAVRNGAEKAPARHPLSELVPEKSAWPRTPAVLPMPGLMPLS